MLHVLKNLTLEIKSKVKLWESLINDRNIHFERLKYLSETLVKRLRVLHFCHKYIWILRLKIYEIQLFIHKLNWEGAYLVKKRWLVNWFCIIFHYGTLSVLSCLCLRTSKVLSLGEFDRANLYNVWYTFRSKVNSSYTQNLFNSQF